MKEPDPDAAFWWPNSSEDGYSDWYDEESGKMIRFFTDGKGNIIEEEVVQI